MPRAPRCSGDGLRRVSAGGGKSQPVAAALDPEAFRILADDNPAGMIVHRRHVPLYLNEAWASCHGYRVDEVMAMPSLLHFLAPGERERMQRYSNERLSGRDVPGRYTYQAMHRDGSTMWVDALVRLVTWRGRAAVMNTIVQVDTERDAARIEAIERVYRDHHLYLSVLSQVQDRISVIDRDLTFRFTNRRNLEFYGCDAAQIIGQHVRDVIGAQRFASALPQLERCLRGEDVNYQRDDRKPDGSPGWVDVSMRPFRPLGDAIEGVVVTLRDITELHQAQESTRASETRLRSVLTNMPGPVFLKDTDGHFQIVNPAFQQNLELEEAQIIGRTVREIADAREAELAIAHDRQVMLSRTPSEREREILIGGEPHTVITSKFPVFDDAGNVTGIGGVEIDISERKRTARALEESERRLFTLMSNLPGMAYRIRTQAGATRTEFVSEGCKILTGHDPSALCGDAGFHATIVHPEDLRQTLASIAAACRQRRPFQLRYRIRSASGETRWVWEQGHVLTLDDGARLAEGFITDISESQHLAEQLSHQARHDPLTDLLNRRAFEEYLQAAVARARDTGEESALVYLDLDRFKAVNDTCGHAAGDELLRQITARMRGAVRRQDQLARLGGDEFGLLMERCTAAQAQRVASDLQRTVGGLRFHWQGHVFTVGASIGLVPITAGSGDAGELMVAADNACYVAKARGRDRVHVYSDGDHEVRELSDQSLWLTRIQEALEHDRLVAHAQPIVALGDHDDEERHCEVLLRMRDEANALIAPAQFLPAAERFGLSPQIDRWVVRQAVEHLRRCDPRLRLSVNLSAQSITDDDVLGFICKAIDDSGVAAARLCFEITETAAIANLDAATRFIAQLRARGCLFSLDDFGSGLSSFGYLKTLPVDFLKIDGLFVRDIASDPIDRALVRSINDIGKVMGKRTIAEFAENERIIGHLRALGVDYAQGYGIARPSPLAQFG